MHAVLPDGAFDHPVGFTISRTSDTPPEAGTAADGSPALIDPILGFRFAFDIPTLNADANLTFTVDLSQLDAVGRANLLNAIGAGIGTIAVKGDAPDATYNAFAQCLAPQTPAADGCVAVTLLNAAGVPAGPNENPAFARFEGVAGHFSSYAVVRVLALDTTAAGDHCADGPHRRRDRRRPARGSPTRRRRTTTATRRRPRLHAGVGERVRDRRHDRLVHSRPTRRATRRRPASSSTCAARASRSPADRQDGRVPRPAGAEARGEGGAPVSADAARRARTRGSRAWRSTSTCWPSSIAPAKAFTAGGAAELVADAVRIEAVLGC